MNASSLSLLDQEELVRLALDSSKNNDSGSTLIYLKEATSRPDALAVAHFLLGAEYAQLQMYDRAVMAMEAAIGIDPALAIARFQLGLLLLTCAEPDRASAVLEGLEPLGEGDALYQFGRGLIHMIRDEFPDALIHLQKGIELNTANLPLNGDMQRIIDEIHKLPAEKLQGSEIAAGAVVPGGQHLFLAAYAGNESSNDAS